MFNRVIRKIERKLVKRQLTYISLALAVGTLAIFISMSAALVSQHRQVAELERENSRFRMVVFDLQDGLVEATENQNFYAREAKIPTVVDEDTIHVRPVYHKVKKGDWLSKIAKWYLGDAQRWPEIHELNPHIKNPHLIYPGDLVRVY